jgi:hypothetical protein
MKPSVSPRMPENRIRAEDSEFTFGTRVGSDQLMYDNPAK